MRPERRAIDVVDNPGRRHTDKPRVAGSRTTHVTGKGGSPMRIMRRILAERKGLFAGNLGLRLVKDLLPFVGPILIGIAVDLLSGTDRSPLGFKLTSNDVRSLVIVAVAMGVLAVAKTVFGYIHTIVAAHMGRHVVEAARRDLAEASMQMALDRRRRFNTGDLLDRSLADSKGLRSFTQNVIIRIISNTVRAVVPLYLMFDIDPVMALIVLAVIPLQSGFSGMLQRRLQRQTRDARSREATHTSAVKEAIDGFNSLASVSGQDWAASELQTTAAASEEAKITKKHTTASISAVINLFTALGIAACYGIGGWRIINSGVLDEGGTTASGALTLGALAALQSACRPVIVVADLVRQPVSGPVNIRLHVVNDLPDEIEHAETTAIWRGPVGTPLEWTFAGSVEADSVARIGRLSLDPGEATGQATLDLRLTAHGIEAENRYEILLAPPGDAGAHRHDP